MAKRKTIQLPKGYLSYSQIQLWKANKERYRKLYYENKSEYRIRNKEMDYGKIVADALENEEKTDDVLTDAAMLLLPKYDIRDKEIWTSIKTKDGWIDLIGKPDTLNSITKAFREYKTGKGKWTQNKAQKHPQMVFYAMIIYLKYKIANSDAYLDWIETEDTINGIKPTGKVESFHVTFTMNDILKCMAETIKVAKEIEIDYASYVPEPEEEF